MEHDQVREKIHNLLWRRGLNMSEASLAIGRNTSYMHGFLARGMPKVLSHQDAAKLAEVLDCDAAELHHAERPPRRKRAAGKRPPSKQAGTGRGPTLDGAPLAAIPEVEVEASAGPGALAEEFIAERAHWFLPEGMIRHEGGAVPATVRILRVRGDSMMPELAEGDRLLIDTARRVPETGEMFVLWDGNGLVVKRIERVHGKGAPRLRLKSANPAYADYTCLAGEAHIIGKVLWTVRKV